MADTAFTDAVTETVRAKPARQDRVIGLLDSDKLAAMPEPERLKFIREQIGKLNPDIATASDKDLLEAYAELKNAGPMALDMRGDFTKACLIQMPDDNFNTKMKLAPLLSNMDPERLKPLPGTDADWVAIVGHHEAEHCNQFATAPATDDNFGTYKGEIGGDQEAVNRLRKAGKNDIADALIDLRAFTALSDPVHATGIMIDQKHIPQQAYDAAATLGADAGSAVNGYLDRMDLQELNNLGIDAAERSERAEMLLATRPDAYMTILADAQENGKVDNSNPYTKKYIDAATAAWARRGKDDPELLPDRSMKEIVENNPRYLAVHTAMEHLAQDGKMDPVEEKEVKRIMNDSDTRPEIVAELKDRYKAALDPYIEKAPEAATPDPASPKPAPAAPAPMNLS